MNKSKKLCFHFEILKNPLNNQIQALTVIYHIVIIDMIIIHRYIESCKSNIQLFKLNRYENVLSMNIVLG